MASTTIDRRGFIAGGLTACLASWAAPGLARNADPARVSVVSFDLLRPSQGAVGMRDVATKSADVVRRAAKPEKFSAFLLKEALPVVKGPGGGLHVIDHHHLGRALWEAKQRTAHIEVIADLSMHGPVTFWAEMEERGWLHAYDAEGRHVGAEKLPRHLKDMGDDCYRDLAGAVRNAGGYAKTEVPFAEFKWADFFRTRITRSVVAKDFDSAVKQAVRLAGSRDASGLPGYAGSLKRAA